MIPELVANFFIGLAYLVLFVAGMYRVGLYQKIELHR